MIAMRLKNETFESRFRQTPCRINALDDTHYTATYTVEYDRLGSRPMSEPTEETYLGDGLYASFDGYSIGLRTPRDDSDHWVYLEPEVVVALQRFMAGLADIHPELRQRWNLLTTR